MGPALLMLSNQLFKRTQLKQWHVAAQNQHIPHKIRKGCLRLTDSMPGAQLLLLADKFDLPVLKSGYNSFRLIPYHNDHTIRSQRMYCLDGI